MPTIDYFKGYAVFWDMEAAGREHVHIRDNQGRRLGKIWLESNGRTKVEIHKLEVPLHVRTMLLKHVKANAERYRELWKESHNGN